MFSKGFAVNISITRFKNFFDNTFISVLRGLEEFIFHRKKQKKLNYNTVYCYKKIFNYSMHIDFIECVVVKIAKSEKVAELAPNKKKRFRSIQNKKTV